MQGRTSRECGGQEESQGDRDRGSGDAEYAPLCLYWYFLSVWPGEIQQLILSFKPHSLLAWITLQTEAEEENSSGEEMDRAGGEDEGCRETNCNGMVRKKRQQCIPRVVMLVACERCSGSSQCVSCVPPPLGVPRGVVVAWLGRRQWVTAHWWALLCPSCYSSSLCSSKCLGCHSTLQHCIRFSLPLSLSHTHTPSNSPFLFLSLIFSHPPSVPPAYTPSLSLSLIQSHVRRQGGSPE